MQPRPRQHAAAALPVLPVLLALVVAGCAAPVVEPGPELPGAGPLGSPPPPPAPPTAAPAGPPPPPAPAGPGPGDVEPPAVAQPAGEWPWPGGAKPFRLQRVLAGLDPLVGAAFPGDGSGRAFLVQKTGLVSVWKDGAVLPEPFLDLRGRVSQGNEQGLLSLAFAPDFASSRRAYAHFTDLAGDTNVVRYLVEGDRADPASEHRILFVDQPKEFHNGGPLVFGPDGVLYIALGDGGENGRTAQDLSLPFGKVLRVDPSGPSGYEVPPGNPFAGQPGAMPEVWLHGLRNPWRMSFDRATGDLYIGDVGNAKREEVNHVPAGASGLNFGWNSWEGTRRNQPFNTTSAPTWPVAEYTHDEGCAVMGGHVYRGAAIPALQGVYLYGDYCKGTLYGLRQEPSGAWRTAPLHKGPGLLTGFAEDEQGELLLLYYRGEEGGYVMRLIPA